MEELENEEGEREGDEGEKEKEKDRMSCRKMANFFKDSLSA